MWKFASCHPAAVGARVIRRDPVAAGWREDLHRRSLPRDQRVLFLRCLLTRDGGELPGPAQAALWVDAKRVYMELRPDLRRVYAAVSRLDVFAPVLEPLGFITLPGPPVVLDGVPFHSLSLDFGLRSVDGWLAGLVTSELALDIGPRLDANDRTVQHRLAGRRDVHGRAAAAATVRGAAGDTGPASGT